MDVAVVGLGGMGSRIAARLLGAGHRVTVWNRTVQRAEPLAAAGATVAASPAEAARAADHVITMLADPPALLDVVASPDGLAAGLRAGHTLLEMSTVGPSTVHRLADLVPPGVAVMDAPGLGSISEAEAGTLTVFVGGAGADAAAVRPVLEAIGTPVHVGPLGSGAAAQMPDARQMSGIPRPDPQLATGTVTVRVARGSFANPVVSLTVDLTGGSSPKQATTNAEGRAEARVHARVELAVGELGRGAKKDAPRADHQQHRSEHRK